jgi:DNA-binding ferritin-like protein (Dps family)
MSLSNIAAKVIGEKKRWRAYKARTKVLPEPYRAAVDAVERYLMNSGEVPTDGERLATMFEDLADLFERAAADGTPVRDVVGADPVEFVTTFALTYSDGGWIAKERARLVRSIDEAAGDTAGDTGADPGAPR